MKFQAVQIILINAVLVVANRQYEAAKAIRIAPQANVEALSKVIQKLSLPIWKGAVAGIPKPNSAVDVVVPAHHLEEFNALTAGMRTEVMHDDLGASIAAEGRSSVYVAGKPDISWFNSYHPYADHIQWLSDVQAQYPSNSQVVVAGQSVAGRNITGLHFYGNSGPGKPAVIFHSTVHAREWITTLTTEYMIYTLLGNYTTSGEIAAFVDKYDFYIFPVVNPDGFVYTQTNDRLWRKNRQDPAQAGDCIGRDLNRNWPSHWDVSGGASTDPCAEDYKGEVQGDAPENKVLRDFGNKVAAAQGVQMFIDFHSYSQLFMTPYGYSCSARPLNSASLDSLAKGAAAAIAKPYGTRYQYGPICPTIYQATGSSVDYVQDVTKGKYVFTIELRDTGRNGFILPASQILPTGRETWEGIKYLLTNMN